MKPVPAPRGFTLVELMVAITVMALLAVMAWSGVDGMRRAQAQTQAHGENLQVLRAALAQWAADLDALAQMPPVGGLDFDGRVLRMTRLYPYDPPAGMAPGTPGHAGGGSIRVVAWGARTVDGRRQWLRWQSAPLYSRAELQLAWQQAAAWGENATEVLRQREVALADIDEWQVFYYRNNSWSSSFSSAAGSAAAVTSGQAPLPDGVRLVLTLSGGQVFVGGITRDWVRPTVGTGRS